MTSKTAPLEIPLEKAHVGRRRFVILALIFIVTVTSKSPAWPP
ncbi:MULTISPECIES: hypothetical protein [Pseudomonas]|jgi:hypothetical protein|uniref:MFS transporter, ACS family, glucarate transporter n=2 Tax=Pseudomonas fluorescens group TaxID=136843 RepID=A0ABY0VRF3_9PSED|nr:MULTISPECIES: hypothetical protein [Pseudomonas]MDI3186594.1 hypothetical protein [Pseudomonas paracarnis]SDU51205.1 MFS transporter, ACS family, glucarate transporter [Pseudomonas mandelii]SUD31477.1 Uncharacterised protein [Pseudomonas fluorescens]